MISDLKVDQLQKCDETEAGDNNAKCTNSSINFLEPIGVSCNNNINYNIYTKQINNCEDNTDADNMLKSNNILP